MSTYEIAPLLHEMKQGCNEQRASRHEEVNLGIFWGMQPTGKVSNWLREKKEIYGNGAKWQELIY